MPRFAANLTMMFGEAHFLDRFELAAKAGFEAVEYHFPYDHSPQEIASRLHDNGLTQALFNFPPGDWSAGERGLACIPSRLSDVLAGVDRALPYARATGVRRLHLMSGIGDLHDADHLAAYCIAVKLAAEKLADHGIDLLIEPINRRDMPGYFLNDFDAAIRLIEELGAPNLKLLFDIYHRQIMGGDVAVSLAAAMPVIGHIQIASIPARNEPDQGELYYPFILAELDRLGYSGFIGCEYRPKGRTEEGLSWLSAWTPSE